MPLSNVSKYFPLGVCRRFAPPPSLALIVPDINCGSLVNVPNGVSVATSVGGVALGEPVATAIVAVDVMVLVVVTLIVPIVGVTEAVNEVVEVLEGRGLLVVVAVRLGVGDGSGVARLVDVIAGVDVATTAATGDGKPDPIKMIRIPTKSRSVIALKKIPCSVGRSLKAKRVSKPRMLANEKWTAKTKIPCGQIPGTPEPRPNPPALIGK